MEILNKITMKGICDKDVKELLGDNESIDLAQIIGFATGEVTGDKPTQYGDNVWITGEFKAKNLLTGKEFYSPKLYPPPTMHKVISAQLVGIEHPKVQFAFVVGIKKSKQAVGYEYTLRSLIEPKEENNPFAAIENQINDPSKLELKQ